MRLKWQRTISGGLAADTTSGTYVVMAGMAGYEVRVLWWRCPCCGVQSDFDLPGSPFKKQSEAKKACEEHAEKGA